MDKIQKIGFWNKVRLLFKPMKISVDKGNDVDYTAECKYKVMNGHIYVLDCTTHKNETAPNSEYKQCKTCSDSTEYRGECGECFDLSKWKPK